MYCNIQRATPSPGKISAVVVGVAAVAMFVVEGFVVATLYKNWNRLKRTRNSPGSILSGTMAVRIIVFSFMPMLALGLSVVIVAANSDSAAPHIVIAFLPTGAALVFGTQKDVLSSWVFWRKERPVSVDKLPVLRSAEPVSVLPL
ncbi:hypothetical protein V5O48_006500 [Marasmius crinis-equi]|uniref:Uncharacterized protein n=1 Tax=Marasmius crinis-equi TaxID=585013 RepID=A0ABR3FJP4_9AGAR